MQSIDGDSEDRPDAPQGISTAMPLSGDASCIADARQFAAAFLGRARAEHGVAVSARAMDVTQLVVSELVTNARKHAPGPALVELRVTGALVEVTVRDTVRVRPAVGAVDPERIGRHGLEIVQALAEEFHIHLEPAGKRVTARIALADPSDSGPDDTGRLPRPPGDTCSA
ncbi:ATP-binding protein [Streptomyces sp. NPDC002701]|uniref:ATP-binding protein n=1 Tax=Streptomyces sp. NPDC002701 TaxID=3364661 RepID=UPI003681808A